MKITCQSCQSKYNVADEKVQGKIVKIRCRKCGSTIVVQGNGGAATNGSGAAAAPAGTPAGGEADGVQWHVNVGDAEPRKTTCASSLAFGGDDAKTLYVTACEFIYAIALRAPGVLEGPQH